MEVSTLCLMMIFTFLHFPQGKVKAVPCKKASSQISLVSFFFVAHFRSYINVFYLNYHFAPVQGIMRAAVDPCVALISECNAGSVVSIEASIYTLSTPTQYLHSIYTLSTHYLHRIYAVSI